MISFVSDKKASLYYMFNKLRNIWLMIYIAIFKINGKFKTNATAVYLEFIVLTIYTI